MRKQYTKEYVYSDSVQITFYENGAYVGLTILRYWEVDGYLSAKHEDGWVEAYSQEQYYKNEDAIRDLLNDLDWRQELREKMKNNLIV